MGGKKWIGEHSVLEFDYDFAKQGGAIGTLSLGDLPDGFLMLGLVVVVETALVGGSTVHLGEDGGGDADGYLAALGASVGAYKGGGALLTDDLHQVDSAKDGLLMTISAFALTAGKFKVYVHGIQA